jgi:hypothetical protein
LGGKNWVFGKFKKGVFFVGGVLFFCGFLPVFAKKDKKWVVWRMGNAAFVHFFCVFVVFTVLGGYLSGKFSWGDSGGVGVFNSPLTHL